MTGKPGAENVWEARNPKPQIPQGWAGGRIWGLGGILGFLLYIRMRPYMHTHTYVYIYIYTCTYRYVYSSAGRYQLLVPTAFAYHFTPTRKEKESITSPRRDPSDMKSPINRGFQAVERLDQDMTPRGTSRRENHRNGKEDMSWPFSHSFHLFSLALLLPCSPMNFPHPCSSPVSRTLVSIAGKMW